IEFFPEEGKYHYDGHRVCGVNLSPEETLAHDGRCPVCGKKVTVGVLHRVEKLADRKKGFRPSGVPGFHSVIPLPEIIAEVLKVGVSSKSVEREYFGLLQKLGCEFKILLDIPLEEIEKGGSPLISEAISRMRRGDVRIVPGYDGEYGKIRIFESLERREIKGQSMLF
ncbi:MAG: DNA helicase UvrD, partial [Nitrospirota bacterium]